MNTKDNNQLQPYLFFGGRCEEALDFYRKAIGAEVEMLMRFKECPDNSECPADWADKVMHASVRIGAATVMASDGCWTDRQTGFRGFALSLNVSTELEADRRFAALAQGGEIKMPMEKTFFSRKFGMVADRFGVLWMVIVPAEEPVRPRQLETTAA